MSIRLRQDFLDYFRSADHRFLPPCKVYNDDRSLLFVNAGMNQLKKVFMGEDTVRSTKLMNYQICIRAGGKHNDFEDVGFDHTHLTSFEMLGNWSINEYGKREAIEYAFKFLVDKMGLEKDRLYATYFEGNEIISEDTESKDIWKTLLPESHVVPGSYDDNFWMMADDGPCGVCTEIHYDMKGDAVPGDVNVNDKVVEVWNVVFIQYNKTGDKYDPLGKLFVDTGMGFERICMIKQGKNSVYDTDCFRYMFGYAQALTGAEFYRGGDSMVDVSYRIFADHMRTVINALFDGVEFDAKGRGNVLKKIFRRALIYAYVYLNDGKLEPLMNRDAVRGMITDVLSYFLKFKHDVNDIQIKLMAEEKMALGKWFSSKKRYRKLVKKGLDHDAIVKDLKVTCGINEVIIDNMTRLEFTMYQ